jgi:hypothetical protein
MLDSRFLCGAQLWHGHEECGGKDLSGKETLEKWSRNKALAFALVQLLPIDIGFKMYVVVRFNFSLETEI